MEKKKCQQLLKAALVARAFPPSVQYPEHSKSASVVQLFDLPIVVWVPESLSPNQRPACVREGCMCTPGIKEYLSRLVEDESHTTALLYIKYVCRGNEPVCVSTISDSFLRMAGPSVSLFFPYIKTVKKGISKALWEQVCAGIMSPTGLAPQLRHIGRLRHQRYYWLRSLFASKLQVNGDDRTILTAPAINQYMAVHSVPDAKTMADIWLSRTAVVAAAGEALMRECEIKRVVRVDHSQKFCKWQQKYGGDGSKENLDQIRMLLLAQNEIGQIVGRSFTRSENNEETQQMFENILQERVTKRAALDEVLLISDNVNAVRGMVAEVFGENVSVKQDPWHVIHRFSEKIKDKIRRSWLKRELSTAIYERDGQLRRPEIAAQMPQRRPRRGRGRRCGQ